MSKRKWRRGNPITSLDELARQDVIFWHDKPQPKGWFTSWQLKMTMDALKHGIISYAMPADEKTRFSDDELIRAERRLHTTPTYYGRAIMIRILNNYDDGRGDVDDVIDKFENDTGF